ncbi:MAG: 5-formyltetrahydrofolate cyclo-ligase [Kiritimatiellaeota bacterium]|nr:5-formyltetrahydrofolate cyclo-ligase [Kiritimatiellota bacterium]
MLPVLFILFCTDRAASPADVCVRRRSPLPPAVPAGCGRRYGRARIERRGAGPAPHSMRGRGAAFCRAEAGNRQPATDDRSAAESEESAADVRQAKAELRTRLRAVRRRLDSDETARESERICARVLELPEVRTARAVALYAALSGEVNLKRIIEECQRQGKSMLFPRFRAVDRTYEMVQVHEFESETVPGFYGIREPRPDLPATPTGLCRDRRTAWIVPGLAFDGAGGRLGQGGGYYDRLLAGVKGPKIGVAFQWQLLPAVPTCRHDVRLDVLVTGNRVLRFSPRTETRFA